MFKGRHLEPWVGDPRRAYGPNEAPSELAALIGPELDRLIQEGSETNG
ncbi:hypothetical protein FHT86_002671 [Rhizobium sp. BK313]|nr:hypothetical protein [Rhizobium sp. BK313]